MRDATALWRSSILNDFIRRDAPGSVTIKFANEWDVFKGHFPIFSVVPGVVLIDAAIQAMAVMKRNRIFRGFPVLFRI